MGSFRRRGRAAQPASTSSKIIAAAYIIWNLLSGNVGDILLVPNRVFTAPLKPPLIGTRCEGLTHQANRNGDRAVLMKLHLCQRETVILEDDLAGGGVPFGDIVLDRLLRDEIQRSLHGTIGRTVEIDLAVDPAEGGTGQRLNLDLDVFQVDADLLRRFSVGPRAGHPAVQIVDLRRPAVGDSFWNNSLAGSRTDR